MEIVIIISVIFILYRIYLYIDYKSNDIAEKTIKQEMQKLLLEISEKERALENERKEALQKINDYRQSSIIALNKSIKDQNDVLQKREDFILKLRSLLEEDFLKARNWLVEMIADAEKSVDDKVINEISSRYRSYNAVEALKVMRSEKRELIKRLKFLEYEVKTYKEYFPFLLEFETAIFLERDKDFKNEIFSSIQNKIIQSKKEYLYRELESIRDAEIKRLKHDQILYKNNIESQLNRKEIEIESRFKTKEDLLIKKEHIIKSMIGEFNITFIRGRKWLASAFAELFEALDNQKIEYLNNKDRPAPSSADIVKEVKREKKLLLERNKILEYQLKSYKEYFPFLEEFEEAILLENIDFLNEDIDSILTDIDRTTVFLTQDEYNSLSVVERNQLALERYLAKPKENWEIGRLYERYLGYKYESEGWDVSYIGAIKGYEDMGRDLVCKKGAVIHIVQAKCWSANKTIHEKHVFQLFGTALAYQIENGLLPGMVQPILAVTTNLSDIARIAASQLGVIVEYIPLSKDYPMIKCNLNEQSKIYHLPFDQQYDRVKIKGKEECYVKFLSEAEAKGFRRAKRYLG